MADVTIIVPKCAATAKPGEPRVLKLVRPATAWCALPTIVKVSQPTIVAPAAEAIASHFATPLFLHVTPPAEATASSSPLILSQRTIHPPAAAAEGTPTTVILDPRQITVPERNATASRADPKPLLRLIVPNGVSQRATASRVAPVIHQDPNVMFPDSPMVAATDGGAILHDDFARTVAAGGWGRSTSGLLYPIASASLSVDGAVGKVAPHASNNQTITQRFGPIRDGWEARARFRFVGAGGPYVHFELIARSSSGGSQGYSLSVYTWSSSLAIGGTSPNTNVIFNLAANRLWCRLYRQVSSFERFVNGVYPPAVDLGAYSSPSAWINLRLVVYPGTTSNRLAAKVWVDPASEPADWTFVGNDIGAGLAADQFAVQTFQNPASPTVEVDTLWVGLPSQDVVIHAAHPDPPSARAIAWAPSPSVF